MKSLAIKAHMLMIQKRAELQGDRGATAVEYGLLVALIAVVIIVAVVFLGRNLLDTSAPSRRPSEHQSRQKTPATASSTRWRIASVAPALSGEPRRSSSPSCLRAFLIILGIIDFGRLLSSARPMKSASREGARVAPWVPLGTPRRPVIGTNATAAATGGRCAAQAARLPPMHDGWWLSPSQRTGGDGSGVGPTAAASVSLQHGPGHHVGPPIGFPPGFSAAGGRRHRDAAAPR